MVHEGKGRAGEKAKAKAPRKAKRKTLNALIHPSSAAKSRKNVGRTRARQVGVTDAVEMVRPLSYCCVLVQDPVADP